MNEILHAVSHVVVRYLLAGSVAALILVPLTLLVLKSARLRIPVYRHMIYRWA